MEQPQRDIARRPMIPVRVRDKEGRIDTYYTDYILELAKRRIFIRTPKPLPTKSGVEIEFNLKGAPRPLILKGEVIRTSKGTEVGSRLLGAGMGIIFQEIGRDDIKILKDLIHSAGPGELGKEYENFINWIRSLKGQIPAEEKDKIKKEWLSAVVDAARGKVSAAPKPQQQARPPVILKSSEELDPLKRIQLFEELSDEELSEIAGICHKEVFKTNERVFEEGAIGDKFYMIQKGEVRISKIIPGIGEEALVVLKEGAYFGEMALIDEAPRSATAIANTNIVLLAIDKNDFEGLLHDDHDLASKMLWTFVRTLSVRLRETNEKIKSFFAMTGGNQW